MLPVFVENGCDALNQETSSPSQKLPSEVKAMKRAMTNVRAV